MNAICAYCGKDIPEAILASRHYSPARGLPERLYCNKECRALADKRDGFFKQMSEAGKAGRSKSIPISNREKPRRKK